MEDLLVELCTICNQLDVSEIILSTKNNNVNEYLASKYQSIRSNPIDGLNKLTSFMYAGNYNSFIQSKFDKRRLP